MNTVVLPSVAFGVGNPLVPKTSAMHPRQPVSSRPRASKGWWVLLSDGRIEATGLPVRAWVCHRAWALSPVRRVYAMGTALNTQAVFIPGSN